MATYGFAFRDTAGYVTDGANDTYVKGELIPQTRNGITFYWNSAGMGTTNVDNTGDVRLAGVNYGGGGDTNAFTVTLPAPGTYDIRLAVGHYNFGGTLTNQKVVFKDNGSILYTIGPIDVANQSFVDAAGVVYSRAAWPGSNSVHALTFSTVNFTMELSSLTTNSAIAYLSLTQAGSGTTAALTGVTATGFTGAVVLSGQVAVAAALSGAAGAGALGPLTVGGGGALGVRPYGIFGNEIFG